MDVLFGGNNHVEKGGDLLHIEDAHHANVGIDNIDRNVESEGTELGENGTETVMSPPQAKE